MVTKRNLLIILIASVLTGWSTPVLAQEEDSTTPIPPVVVAHSGSGLIGAPQEWQSGLPVGGTFGSNDSASDSSRPSIARPVVANPRRATIALALGGGGVRGAAHIGVLRVFEREGIPVDFIAGNSMGAVVGGMYAAGVPLDSLEQMFVDHSLFKAFAPVPVGLKLMTIPPRALVRSIKRLTGLKTGLVGLYSTNGVAELVNTRVSANMRNIEDTAIPFVAVATNVLDGRTYALESGNLGRAVQASSAIPLYIKPIEIDGKLLVDGALRANVPTLQARRSEADIVISVNVDEDLRAINQKSLRSTRRFTDLVMSMMLAQLDEQQAAMGDLEIRPRLVGIPLYSRSDVDAVNAMHAGEAAAMRAIPKIRALMNGKLAKL